VTRPVVLILSGAYIDQELAAELGVLPPALAPVGMGRLYDLQIDALGSIEPELFLTLPQALRLSSWDEARLAQAGVTLLPSPEGLNLGGALLFALATLGFEDRPIRVLHGDTLIRGLDLEALDAVSVAGGADGYWWATVRETEGRVDKISAPDPGRSAIGDLRLSGYFAFSSAQLLAQALALARGDFIGALNVYNGLAPLSALKGGEWLDFGHVQTFFRSRRVVSTARGFNQLVLDEVTARKRSDRPDKLRAEARWLAQAPAAIRPFCARLIEEGEDAEGYFYATDYEYLPTLAELHVFGRLNRASWTAILSSCGDFLAAAAATPPPEPQAPTLPILAIDKTRARLEVFAATTGFDLDAPLSLNGRAAPSLNAILAEVEQIVARCAPRPALMHGDFCFSNILYNSRMRRIRLIDPRGAVVDGEPSLWGDSLYDGAKLMHSLAGRYDLIIAGRCQGPGRLGPELELSFDLDPEQAWREAAAAEMQLGGLDLGTVEIRALVIALFLSMPPLHADRPARQSAMLANAVRLYLDLQGRSGG
jgi:hypothetical protein